VAVKASFGRGQRLRIGAGVLLVTAAAAAVWVLANWVATRPQLRTTLDLSRGGRFTLAQATLDLVAEVRSRQLTLEIDTFYRSPRDAAVAPVARIQERVVSLTNDLLERLDYFGGDQVKVVHHDIYREIRSAAQAARGLGLEDYNTVALRLGPRQRKLSVLGELADIELPDGERQQMGQPAQPVLRSYQGETAIASALKSLLSEGELPVCWVGGHYEARPDDRAGGGANQFARALFEAGFTVRKVDRIERIPEDCRLLVILGPEGVPLGRGETTALLAYLRSGGRALLTLHADLGDIDRAPQQVELRELFAALGIACRPKLLLNAIQDPGDPQRFVYGHPEMARILVRDGLNATHPVTRRMREAGVAAELHHARALDLQAPLPEGVLAEPLLSTHAKAWLVDVPPPGEGFDLRKPSDSEMSTQHVGVSIEVRAAAEGGRPGRLVVLGGRCFVNGEGLFQANRLLALNLADWLVRDRTLVAVPAETTRGATMNVERPQIDRLRLALVWLLPGGFLALAVFLVFWRRRG
jgi:hypothetical protein